ncbi:MAG: imidazolonepropionase [Phycisphaerae bacterium]
MFTIRNIGQLVLPTAVSPPMLNDAVVTVVDQAYVTMDGGAIRSFGSDAEYEGAPGVEVIDAQGNCVIPGLIDCHTHTVFAGSREDDFVKRIQGTSYAQIAEQGGGIKTTVKAVREAGIDELVALALPRLNRMLANGVTTVEIKSGYGLSVEDEIKMLQAVKKLRDVQPIELVATYLGAHTVPHEYTGRREAYIDLVCSDELMGRVAREGLAEFCDVFTEKTAFTVEESRRILLKAKEFGLTPKMHADQITQIGASRLAAEVGAVSADHLETIDDGGIAAMKDAGVVAVLLPGCSFFLGVDQAPARRIMDAGLPVALATDYNPGSAMVESLPLVMSMACTQMHMTPAEALVATTANAAAAINRQDRIGTIKEGMQADLVILDVDNYNELPYHTGRNCVRTVIKRGRIVRNRD